MARTVVVLVELKRWVNKYRGWYVYLHKYMAHDSLNTCNIGDVVKIEQLSKRISKRKAFNVVEILQRENIFVVADASGAAQQAPSKGKPLFRNVPEWAALTPLAAQAITAARTEFYNDCRVSEQAVKLAKALMLQPPSLVSDADKKNEPGEAEACRELSTN
jgi:ribosomal protein S17